MNQKKSLISKLENYPIGICGTSLGLITVSTAWQINGINFLKPLAIIFTILALSLMLIRIVVFPKKIIQEIKHPVLGSFYPTIDMGLMLIAAYFLNVAPRFAKGLWLACIIVHFILFIVFFAFRIKGFKLEHMVPSWFVVWVGVVVACVTSTGMGYDKLAQWLFYFGFIIYIITWPIMLYRVFNHKAIEEHHLPTIGIMAAPASLCLVGYITAFKTLNPIILGVLIVISIINLLLVYTYIVGFIKKGFAPIYASLTFPLAISIMAAYKVSEYLMNVGGVGGGVFKVLGDIEIFIGTGVIFYVVFNFLLLFVKAISPRAEETLELEESLLGKTTKEETLPDNTVEELLK
ncbi:TDT family transporter [Clostridium sardiniense]|uniref:TDT family transporter n=1 Tax=Clostridium sardiniense TaxID=29369 RepID=A0ABS7L0A3_CLOSR|nr:TDT family transporter [Clostridium sardiniense]MBY0756490.1 TDT family transporter [Clostridium sardiniense]MDQ0460231.1 exfoliative toxin A/B [Clostridium sardiniense]